MDDIIRPPQTNYGGGTGNNANTGINNSVSNIPDQPLKSKTSDNKTSKKSTKLVLLVILLVLVFAADAGGVYYWQHQKVKSLDVQVASLQNQASNLNDELSKANATAEANLKASKATTTTTTTTAASCTSSDLSLSLGQPSGAAGTNYIDLILTNTSTSTCSLKGYPTVVLVDSKGQLGQPAGQNAGSTATTITIGPKQTAHSVAGFPEPGNYTLGTCSTQSTDIKVTPPGQTTAIEAPAVQQYCPGFSVSTIQSGS